MLSDEVETSNGTGETAALPVGAEEAGDTVSTLAIFDSSC
jgi:hypothetical protein